MKPLLNRLVCTAWAFAPAVFAAGEAAPARRFAAPDLSSAPAPGAASGFGQMLFGLVMVLGAVFVVAVVARRLRGGSRTGSNGIEVLAQASLGAKEKVVIVRVDGERLLLGVATGQVSLLRTLSPAAIDPPPAVTGTPVQNFAALLKRSLGK